MAGRDVTPAPEIALQMEDHQKRTSVVGGTGAFSAIAGSSSESEVYSSHGKISSGLNFIELLIS